ncbi:MAG: ABC transporter permease [Anaerolineae bacterium]|nr:ABC transporter permease [Anaerolineae bacterium]
MTDVTTTPNGIAKLSTEAQHVKAESMTRIIMRRFFRHRMAVIGSLIMLGIIAFVIGGAFIYPEAEGNIPDPTSPFVQPTLESLYNEAPNVMESEIPSLLGFVDYEKALALLDEAVQYQMITEADRQAILQGTDKTNRFNGLVEDEDMLNKLKIFEGLRLIRVQYAGISNPNLANDTFWVSLQRFNPDNINRLRAQSPTRASEEFGVSDEIIDARVAYLAEFNELGVNLLMGALDNYAIAETRFQVTQVTLQTEGVFERVVDLDPVMVQGLIEKSAQLGLITETQKQDILNGVESASKYNDQIPEVFDVESIQILTWIEGLRFYGVWTGNLDRFPVPDRLDLATARNTFSGYSDEQITALSNFRKEFQDTRTHHVITRLNNIATAEARVENSQTFLARFRHVMGTDQVGRDLFIRMVYGGQISLMIGITSVIISISLGTLVGLISGYFGGWIGALLMRFVEALLAIPALILLLLLSNSLSRNSSTIVILGRELSTTVIVIVLIIGGLGWMGLSRIVRSLVLSLKEQEFVVAARTLGAGNARIIFKHILPNCIAPIVVSATLGIGGAIITEAYLSFLGFGVQEPTATWGNILNRAQGDIARYWWMWLFPGIFITLTVLSINFIGDGLRDALDPRSLR